MAACLASRHVAMGEVSWLTAFSPQRPSGAGWIQSGLHVTIISRIISWLVCTRPVWAWCRLLMPRPRKSPSRPTPISSKRLTFTSKQDLDFGTIMPARAGHHTVSMSMAGVITCPSGGNLHRCRPARDLQRSGLQQRAWCRSSPRHRTWSTRDRRHRSRSRPTAPATITLTNSGQPGNDFNVGGSIAIPSTADGTYIGNIEVTVDYQ